MTTLNSPRPFVPSDLDPADLPRVEALYRSALDRPLATAADIEAWLLDLSALDAAVDECFTRRSNANSCDTESKEKEQAYLFFVQEVFPKLKPIFFEIQKKFVASPARKDLKDPRFAILTRKWQADVELFRDANIPLQTKISELGTDYGRITGRMTVEFRGQTYTLQQLARFLDNPDRSTRQQAWSLSADRRLKERDEFESIFDKIFALRVQIAQNAGLSDFREYMWKSMKRFDYTPAQCLSFGDAIEKECLPVIAELDRKRRADLGVHVLRPWDLGVDPMGRPALRPFEEKDIAGFVSKTREVFRRLSPELASQFGSLKMGENLDLDSRLGKRPGGYQASLELSKQPFIFMNAAGLQDDVETLLHEAGHAFHYLAACREPIIDLRSPGLEFCEVASMSMELIAADHLDVFYSPADAKRAKRGMLERVIRFLPWMAIVDGFQHWLYTHPTHTREERRQEWLAIHNRFSSPILDWNGLNQQRSYLWHRQLHIFHYAFYYIEYGIAQLGALQLWLQARDNPAKALANYQKALALGGTRPLPELFAAAEIKFDFSEATLRPLMKAIGEEMAKL